MAKAPMDLGEVLALLESGQWMRDLCYVQYDAKRKLAGSLIRIPECRYKPRFRKKSPAVYDPNSDLTRSRRNPLHYYHATRNVALPSGLARKVHIRLIYSINGHKVI